MPRRHPLPPIRLAATVASLGVTAAMSFQVSAQDAPPTSQPASPPATTPPTAPATTPTTPTPDAAPARPARDRSRVAADRLAPGQKAPELAIESWIKGEPVTAFEPGTIYVIEFWATWCGPCISGIGHLTGLQHEFKDKKVVVIGVTARDPRNELPGVKAMVDMRGDGMDYRVAWDGSGTTFARFMTKAKLTGIPASFVVGKEGIIEFIGHPTSLDLVLPKLVDGTWDRNKDLADVRAAEGVAGTMEKSIRNDPAKAKATFESLAARWPRYADQYLGAKAEFERQLGNQAAADAAMDAIEARATEHHDVVVLRGIAVRGLPQKSVPGMLERSLRAAEKAARFSGEKDGVSLRIYAKALEATGDMPKAIEAMKKAIAVTEAPMKQRLQEELDAWTSPAPSETPKGETKTDAPAETPAAR